MAKAVITIDNPGSWSFQDRADFAAWLQEQAEYVLSNDHDDRSEGAANCRLEYPPPASLRAAREGVRA